MSSFFIIEIHVHFYHFLAARTTLGPCMENFFICRNIYTKFGMYYCRRQCCNLRLNCSDWTTIACRCLINQNQVLVRKLFYHGYLGCLHAAWHQYPRHGIYLRFYELQIIWHNSHADFRIGFYFNNWKQFPISIES